MVLGQNLGQIRPNVMKKSKETGIKKTGKYIKIWERKTRGQVPACLLAWYWQKNFPREFTENCFAIFDQSTGLRQTWKTWKKQCFLWHSGKTWKTQRILRKHFKFLENSGNSVETDFLINLLYFFATIYLRWHYLLFTLYTTVIAAFFYLHIYLVSGTGCCLKWPTLAVCFETQKYILHVHFIICYIDSFYFFIGPPAVAGRVL